MALTDRDLARLTPAEREAFQQAALMAAVNDYTPAMGAVLPFRDARDEEDEKHVHPLQLDVIDRCLTLWSNPGERILTPFMGVGSEVHEAVRLQRFGIGVELKPSYYRQAVKNLAAAAAEITPDTLFDLIEADSS